MHIRRQEKVWDAVIVGSGAGGGMAAHTLAHGGAQVLVLEAGPLWYSPADSAMLQWAYDSPRRGASTHERPFGQFDAWLGGGNPPPAPSPPAPAPNFPSRPPPPP